MWNRLVNTFLGTHSSVFAPSLSLLCPQGLFPDHILLDRPDRENSSDSHSQGRTHSCCLRVFRSTGPVETLVTGISSSCPTFSSPLSPFTCPFLHPDFIQSKTRSESLAQYPNFLASQDHLPINCSTPNAYTFSARKIPIVSSSPFPDFPGSGFSVCGHCVLIAC